MKEITAWRRTACLLLAAFLLIPIIGIAEDAYPIASRERYIGYVKFTKADETRQYPYEASDLVKSYASGAGVSIRAKVTNKYGNIWYETNDGTYMYSGDVEVQWYQESGMDAYYHFNNDNEVRAQPFESSAVKEYMQEEDIVWVFASVKNKYGNIWYETTGGFVYSGDVDYSHTITWEDRIWFTCNKAMYSHAIPYDSGSKVKQYAKGEYVYATTGVKNSTWIGTQNDWVELQDGSYLYAGDLTVMYRLVSLPSNGIKKGTYQVTAGTSLYARPFTEGSGTYVAAGTELSIVEGAVNNLGDSWYRVDRAGSDVWISGEKIRYIGTVTVTGSTSGTTSGTPSGNLIQGNSFNLKGTLTASDTISSVTGGVYDNLTGNAALAPVTVTPNAKTLNLNTSAINKNLKFGQLPIGNYRFIVTATLSTGYTKELINSRFNVIEASATPLKITTQPKSVTVSAAGNTATAKVVAQGDGLSYQWYEKLPGASGFSKSSVKTASYSRSVTEDISGIQIYCLVSDSHGGSVASNTVSLSIVQSSGVPMYGGEIIEYYAKASTNVRSDASTSASVVGTLAKGQHMWCWFDEQIESDGYTWGHCYLEDGTEGWIAISNRDAVTPFNSSVNKTSDTITEYAVTTSNGLHILGTAGSASSSIFVMPKGTHFWAWNGDTQVKGNYTYYHGFVADGTVGWAAIAQYGEVVEHHAAIVEQPQNLVVDTSFNETPSVTISAEGDGLSYQWWEKGPNDSAFAVSEQNTEIYFWNDISISQNGFQVYAVVTDKYGNSVTSDTATLTLRDADSIALSGNMPDGSIAMLVNRTAFSNVEQSPANAWWFGHEWTSADPQIATVDNGVITAHQSGATTITCTSLSPSAASASITVTVYEEPAFAIETSGVQEDGTFTVTIGLSANHLGLDGLHVSVWDDYEGKGIVFENADCLNGTQAAAMTDGRDIPLNGALMHLFAYEAPITGNGDLFRLHFRVPDRETDVGFVLNIDYQSAFVNDVSAFFYASAARYQCPHADATWLDIHAQTYAENGYRYLYCPDCDKAVEVVTLPRFSSLMSAPDLLLPAQLQIIGEEAFAGSAAAVVVLPETVVRIEDRAFALCSNLREIYIPESVQYISPTAFDKLDVQRITVFGVPGSRAEDFAQAIGCGFSSGE